MGRNVEIKARLRDAARVRALAEAIADGPAELIEQHDSFYRCPDGRLKLRRFADGSGELIFYRRDDSAGPRESHFIKSPIPDPKSLAEALGAALGVLGELRKRRTLYLSGQTRIHLDEVEGLGDFLELEVVLEDEQSLEEGSRIARGLMAELGISDEDLVPVAYIDLLLK
jgi:predicted adenylyl cyclase CyaB